jgi:cation diffusion facilitator family transporter
MTEIEGELKFFEKPIFVNFLLLIVNMFLFVLKIVLSYTSNSLALQADAFDNLTDIVMIFAALIGINFSRKKPNEKFPYGYYKIENLISLIISIFIFYTAYTIIFNSIGEIVSYSTGGSTKQIVVSSQIFILLIFALLLSFCLTIYLKIVGKRTNSPIIQTEANEKLYDNLISASVLIGFIGALYNIFILDAIISLIIALFIIKGGYNIFLSSTKTLLDAVIDFENRTELHTIINSVPNIKKIENLEIRSYGKYVFLEITISLNREISLSNIEHLQNILFDRIKKSFPQIFKIVLIAQTQEKAINKIAAPISDNQGVTSEIYDHYGESPYFAIIKVEQGKMLHLKIIPNEFINEEKRKGILISDWLSSKKIDKIYVKNDLKKGPKLIFEKSLIQIELTDFDTLDQLIEREKELSLV